METPSTDAPQVDGQDLERVKQCFADWRARRRTGARIPQQLWEAACSLHPRYTIMEIVRALHLDYVDVRKRIRGESGRLDSGAAADSSAFVALPAIPSTGVAEAKVRLRDGRRVHIRIKLKDVGVGSVVELLRGVWG
jgi:hypothetical protein